MQLDAPPSTSPESWHWPKLKHHHRTPSERTTVLKKCFTCIWDLSISTLLLTKVLITIFVISSTSFEIWFKVHLCHLGASGSNSAFQTWATWQCNKLSNGIRRMTRLTNACKFLKQLRPTWLLCSPAMDKAKHAAAIFSLPQKHSDNYHCPFWAPVLQKSAGKPNLEINATCMSWIQLHKCISTISYLARWHLVGLKCKSCSSFMAPDRRTSDSLEPLASPQEFWAMCDILLLVLKSESLTPSIKLLCQGWFRSKHVKPPSIICSFTQSSIVIQTDSHWYL